MLLYPSLLARRRGTDSPVCISPYRFACLHFAKLSNLKGWDVAQLVERRTGTPLMQDRIPVAAGDFSPRVNFQCRLSYGVRTPPCAVACVSICEHVKGPVVHVKVRWIMETLHPACTVGWVRLLSRGWFFPGKDPEFSMGKIPMGQYSYKSFLSTFTCTMLV